MKNDFFCSNSSKYLLVKTSNRSKKAASVNTQALSKAKKENIRRQMQIQRAAGSVVNVNLLCRCQVFVYTRSHSLNVGGNIGLSSTVEVYICRFQ